MSTELNIGKIAGAIAAVLAAHEGVTGCDPTVFIEPTDQEHEYPSISIFRRDSPFEVTTVNRAFRVSPTFDLECATLDFNGRNAAFVALDTLVDSVVRALTDNKTLQNSVTTSKVVRFTYFSGSSRTGDGDNYIAVAVIGLETTITYQ